MHCAPFSGEEMWIHVVSNKIFLIQPSHNSVIWLWAHVARFEFLLNHGMYVRMVDCWAHKSVKQFPASNSGHQHSAVPTHRCKGPVKQQWVSIAAPCRLLSQNIFASAHEWIWHCWQGNAAKLALVVKMSCHLNSKQPTALKLLVSPTFPPVNEVLRSVCGCFFAKKSCRIS